MPTFSNFFFSLLVGKALGYMQEVARLPLLLLLPTLLQQPCPAAALNNGRLRTPPLGFSDACLGGAENTRLSAAQMQVVADGFISTGLAALGYTRMNFDDRQGIMFYLFVLGCMTQCVVRCA